MGFYRGPHIVTDGLVLCLDAANPRSYPGTGTTWTDLSGNNNNATLTNGAAFNSSTGGSIVFDGSNDYCVTSTSTTLNIGTGAYTVSVWIKLDGISDNRIIYKRFGGIGNGYSLFCRNNKFGFEVLSASTFKEMYSNNTFSANAFYNVTAVFNRNTTSYMYVNGIQDGNLDMTNFSGVDITNNINYYLGTAAALYGGWLDGNIYTVSQYNRALTATEIQQNYNATKTRFNL